MTGRTRGLCILILATGAASAVLATVFQEPPVFRSTAELVRVPAVVFDSDGGPVMDLTAADFKITLKRVCPV